MQTTELIDLAIRQGGATIRLSDMSPVGPSGELACHQMVVGLGEGVVIKQAELESALLSFRRELGDTIEHVGLWHRPDGLWELEGVVVVVGRQTACLVGRHHDQFSVYDLQQGVEVLVQDGRELHDPVERAALYAEWKGRR